MRNSKIINNPGEQIRFMPNRQTMPGTALGIKTQQQVQQFNLGSMRAQGSNNAYAVGQNTFDVKFPGDAKRLFGFLLYDDTPDIQNVFSLSINNDTKYKQVSSVLLTRNNTVSNFNELFVPYDELLSGNDQFQVIYEVLNSAGNLAVVFYFI